MSIAKQKPEELAPIPIKSETASTLSVAPVKKTLPGIGAIPSLKNLNVKPKTEDSPVEKKQEPVIEALVNKDFSEDEFRQAWSEYSNIVEKESKMSLHTLMMAHPPKLLPNQTIEIITESKLQEDILAEERLALMRFLRQRLQNNKIQLQSIEAGGEDVGLKRLYTSHDKFKHLAEKNPSLLELRKRLDLEVEV